MRLHLLSIQQLDINVLLPLHQMDGFRLQGPVEMFLRYWFWS